MILLCGIPSEPPLSRVQEELEKLNTPYVLFNQRYFYETKIHFEITAYGITGQIALDGQNYSLENITGVYTRLIDYRYLPEIRNEARDSPKFQKCQAVHDVLTQWIEITPARVINRSASMGSNFSKPYQAQLIRQQGFVIPETLITNEPELVRDFLARHKKVVYKSISSVRSIVQILNDKDLTRLDQIRWCPVQFQEFIEGTNIRVHVIDNEVFATSIITDAVDYRYAERQGFGIELAAFEITPKLADRCINLSRSLGLVFSGIDLKITPDGRVFCFEINPSPGFSYYEAGTGQPIAQAVARYLTARS